MTLRDRTFSRLANIAGWQSPLPEKEIETRVSIDEFDLHGETDAMHL